MSPVTKRTYLTATLNLITAALLLCSVQVSAGGQPGGRPTPTPGPAPGTAPGSTRNSGPETKSRPAVGKSRRGTPKRALSGTGAPKLVWTASENADLGKSLFGQGKYAEAEPYYREAVRLEPGNARFNNELGVLLIGPQNSPEARSPFDTSLDAIHEDSLRAIKAIQGPSKRQVEAESYCRKAVRSEPDNARYNYHLGRALYHSYKSAEAEPYFREAIRLEPGNAEYYNYLGMAFLWRVKHAEAEPFFREAVRLSPSHASLRYNLGRTLYEQKKHAEAETQFQEAVRLDPSNAKYQKTLTYMKLENLRR